MTEKLQPAPEELEAQIREAIRVLWSENWGANPEEFLSRWIIRFIRTREAERTPLLDEVLSKIPAICSCDWSQTAIHAPTCLMKCRERIHDMVVGRERTPLRERQDALEEAAKLAYDKMHYWYARGVTGMGDEFEQLANNILKRGAVLAPPAQSGKETPK
jgi:hypothetical protein